MFGEGEGNFNSLVCLGITLSHRYLPSINLLAWIELKVLLFLSFNEIAPANMLRL
jgi:hypothetical protein